MYSRYICSFGTAICIQLDSDRFLYLLAVYMDLRQLNAKLAPALK